MHQAILANYNLSLSSLIRVRSSLLTKSLLIFIPIANEIFHFTNVLYNSVPFPNGQILDQNC